MQDLIPTVPLKLLNLNNQLLNCLSIILGLDSAELQALRIPFTGMWILILGESTHLTWILARVEINHQGNQQSIGNTVWQVMECAQLMSHGVWHTPRNALSKRHTSHTGSIRHLLTCLNICRLIVSGWKVIKYVLHGLKRKAVCIVGCHDGCICLQCMGQYVNAGCAGQSGC